MVDSVNAPYFLTGDASDATVYTFMKPCINTNERVVAFDLAATANKTPSFIETIKGATKPDDYTINHLTIEKEDRAFANSLINIVEDVRTKQRLLAACKGSGRKLVGLIDAESKNLTRKQQTLAKVEFENYIKVPIVGPTTLESFENWYELYEKHFRRVPSALRVQPSATVQTLLALVLKDAELLDRFDYELKLEKPDPDNLDDNLRVIKNFLRDRGDTKLLATAFDGGPASSGALALASIGYSRAQIDKLM